ncbi:MAG: hypothetical protein ACI9LM_000125 [Alteromonadaceae bacterium]
MTGTSNTYKLLANQKVKKMEVVVNNGSAKVALNLTGAQKKEAQENNEIARKAPDTVTLSNEAMELQKLGGSTTTSKKEGAVEIQYTGGNGNNPPTQAYTGGNGNNPPSE